MTRSVTARSLVAITLARDLLAPVHPPFGTSEPPLPDIAGIVLATLRGHAPELPVELPDVDLWDLLLAEPGTSAADDLRPMLFFHSLVTTEAMTVDRGRFYVVPGLDRLLLETLADLVEGAPMAPGGTTLGSLRARQGAVHGAATDLPRARCSSPSARTAHPGPGGGPSTRVVHTGRPAPDRGRARTS